MTYWDYSVEGTAKERYYFPHINKIKTWSPCGIDIPKVELTWPFPTKIQARDSRLAYGSVPSQRSCPRRAVERAWIDLLSPASWATPAASEGTGPVLSLSGRHGMLRPDKRCGKRHKTDPIHVDSACTCYLQLPWAVTDLTASLFWGQFLGNTWDFKMALSFLLATLTTFSPYANTEVVFSLLEIYQGLKDTRLLQE